MAMLNNQRVSNGYHLQLDWFKRFVETNKNSLATPSRDSPSDGLTQRKLPSILSNLFLVGG